MNVQRWFPVVAFLTMVAFWPWWEGGALATRWGVLAVGAPLLLLQCDLRLTPLHWIGLAFLGWGAITLTWTPVETAGVAELARFIILAAVFLVAAELEDLRWTYIAIIAGVAISGVVAIAQFLGYVVVPQLNSPAGLFVNRNFLAEISATALILTIGLRLWWVIPIILCGTFLPHSRGVALGLACSLLVWLWSRSRMSFVCVVVSGVILLFVPLPFILIDSSSLLERVGVWIATVQHFTIFGHGIGSFYVAYPEFMPHPILLQVRPAHAHNEALNTISDLGLPGIILLGAFTGFAIRYAGAVERLVLMALFGMSLFSFPLHVPATGFIFALMAGTAARRWHVVHGRELARGAASVRDHAYVRSDVRNAA